MASRFGLRGHEYSDSCLHGDPNGFCVNNPRPRGSCWVVKTEHKDQEDSLREQLKELDEHAARLQDMLKSERAKSTRLQLKCNHQEAELRHRELQSNRLKERLSQQTDRYRGRGPSIDVLNFPPGKGRRELQTKTFRTTSTKSIERKQEAALRLMLERREAELREAMKLRHSLTTLLHALRVDMEQALLDSAEGYQNDDKSLDQAEVTLGKHLTGGVVHSWRDVQKRMFLSEGQTTGGTDHDKLLAQLETELKESRQLVELQQQLLQDNLNVAVPSELADSYYLEEWERIRMHWVEFDHQRRTFERERQCFTDAAIRLGRERQEFEQQRASLVKQQYLCEASSHSTELTNPFNYSSLGINKLSGSFSPTPTSTELGTTADPVSHQERVGVRTPNTPELYCELSLPYNSRDATLQSGEAMRYGMLHTPPASRLDWSFQ